MKTVTVEIKAGKVSVDFAGFQGKSCEALENRIRPEQMTVDGKELKSEYHCVPGNTEQEKYTS